MGDYSRRGRSNTRRSCPSPPSPLRSPSGSIISPTGKDNGSSPSLFAGLTPTLTPAIIIILPGLLRVIRYIFHWLSVASGFDRAGKDGLSTTGQYILCIITGSAYAIF